MRNAGEHGYTDHNADNWKEGGGLGEREGRRKGERKVGREITKMLLDTGTGPDQNTPEPIICLCTCKHSVSLLHKRTGQDGNTRANDVEEPVPEREEEHHGNKCGNDTQDHEGSSPTQAGFHW